MSLGAMQASAIVPVPPKNPGGDYVVPTANMRRDWNLDLPINQHLAYAYVSEIAFGNTLAEIEKRPEMPPAKQFLLWMMQDPAILRAYMMAREMSGFMMEDEALQIAREIAQNPPKSNIAMRAIEKLIDQLKWTAGKRNPQTFSDKAQVNVTVPVQINTTLDMGGEQSQGTAQFPNIYEMRATVGVEVDTPGGQVAPRKDKKGETPAQRDARKTAERLENSKRAKRQQERLEYLRKRAADMRAAKKRKRASGQSTKKSGKDAKAADG